MNSAVNDPAVIDTLLRQPGVWAVVGLSENRGRTAYEIAQFLQGLGHRIVPVHPSAATVLDSPGYAALAELPDGASVDVVDCFVNSALVGSVVDEAIEQRDRLGIRAVWLQLGVIDHAAADRALAAGLDVVMNTCPAIEWPRR